MRSFALKALALACGLALAPLFSASPLGGLAGHGATAAAAESKAAKSGPRFMRAHVKEGEVIWLRRSPGGKPIREIESITEFVNPRVMSVTARRRGWLAVQVPEIRDNRARGWIRADDPRIRISYTRFWLRADLSRRTLALWHGKRRVMRTPVAIGRPGSPTPLGRFGVTDKVAGAPYGSYYGCCILALTGHQPRLPPGWSGGDLLGIHGTNQPSSVGQASSAGCLRVHEAPLRQLMRKVPVGAPLFVVA